MSKRLDYNQIAPAGVKALGGVYGYVMQSGLPAVLVDLVYLRISQINNCAYCLDMHTRDLLKKGQKIEKLALLQAWREAGNLFDERERAALAWAETVTRVAETGVPDEAYQAARAVFEERELVDLTIAIGLMNAYNRMAISFPEYAAGCDHKGGRTMKVVVIGGTGLTGSKTVAILRQGGHEVVAASPKSGIDTITGEGLKKAEA